MVKKNGVGIEVDRMDVEIINKSEEMYEEDIVE